jgi:flagellar protein FlaG
MDIVRLQGQVEPLTAPVSPAGPDKAAETRELVQAIKALNAAEMFGQENELTFAIDPATQRAIIRVVNRNSKEVVRQLPPEYVLQVAEEIRRDRR